MKSTEINQAAIKGYPHGNPPSQLGSPNWESSAAQLICRASLLPVDDGEVLGPKVGCLGALGLQGFFVVSDLSCRRCLSHL